MIELATVGGGCFWCLEAIFQRLQGVESVVSGYAGGHVHNPSYAQVCQGTTGHAEVIQIRYDPLQIDFATLLDVFWTIHDPTTLNRQGNDEGTQYRSIILSHTPEQDGQARASLLQAQSQFSNPIVTEIVALDTFYAAEREHQNYYNDNPQQPYCNWVVAPKVHKFEQRFAARLRD